MSSADAFARRVAGYRINVHRYARKLARSNEDWAADLAQETMERALEKRDLYDERGKLLSWLLNLCHNLYVNEIRRRARRGASHEVDEVEAGTVYDEHGTQIRLPPVPATQEMSLLMRDLHRALRALPREMAEVLILVGSERRRYEEVALLLDIPLGTVRSRLSRGRAALRRYCEEGPGTRRGRHAA